jgi:hypothetical protein
VRASCVCAAVRTVLLTPPIALISFTASAYSWLSSSGGRRGMK